MRCVTLRAMGERIAIIGDVHGDVDAFVGALAACGVDARAGSIPEDLTVIQTGDLVHNGPDSAGCVAVADGLITHPRYIQLIGNHDGAHLGAPYRSPRLEAEHSHAEFGEVIRHWWHKGHARLAVAAHAAGRAILITHAGLTHGQWRALGCPDATGAAQKLNAHVGAPAMYIASGDGPFAGGILTGEGANPNAGVIHAAACEEFARPWLAYTRAAPAPFDQVFGHASPWAWRRGEWEPEADGAIQAHTVIDHARRHVTLHLGRGGRATSVDPAGGTPTPLLLAGAAVI